MYYNNSKYFDEVKYYLDHYSELAQPDEDTYELPFEIPKNKRLPWRMVKRFMGRLKRGWVLANKNGYYNDHEDYNAWGYALFNNIDYDAEEEVYRLNLFEWYDWWEQWFETLLVYKHCEYIEKVLEYDNYNCGWVVEGDGLKCRYSSKLYGHEEVYSVTSYRVGLKIIHDESYK